jgi:hypothetical protein
MIAETGAADAPGSPIIGSAVSGLPRAMSFAEMESSGPAEVKWLWHGFLAAGSVTLLTGLWRAGKTTLLSVLLARMREGGTLGGRTVAAGRAVIISEEDSSMWRMRGQTLEYGPHAQWYCKPFLGKPAFADWQRLLDQIGREHERLKIDLLVIDGLANLSPMRSENESGEMLKTLLPLNALTAQGVSVWVSHHPSKGRPRQGQAARGSGSLMGFVDIILELERVSQKNMKDARRRLRAWSRFVETPPKWVIEMTPDGADYLSLGESGQPTFDHGWQVLKRILEDAEAPLTVKQIVRRWPSETAAPSKATLHRWLERLLPEGKTLREGRGTRNQPHTYQLPGMELEWRDEMLRSLVGPPARRRRRKVED